MAPEQEAKLRVLHPTDGSVIARRSAGLLKQLVLQAADRLEVLSVAPHSVLSGARPDPFFLTKVTPVARKCALIESEEWAQQVATEFDPPPISVQANARWGNPVQEILRASRRPRADLIVLGAKGHSNLGLMMLGSVSQGVVQHSTVPVLVVRPTNTQVRRLLVGFDNSHEARRALNFVDRIQIPRDIELILSFVISPFPGSTGGKRRRKELIEAQATADQHRAAAERALESVALRFSDLGYKVSTELLAADAAPELDASARSHGADLIVVGSRKPAPARHYLIGSTAEKLVRHAEASVLVVR